MSYVFLYFRVKKMKQNVNGAGRCNPDGKYGTNRERIVSCSPSGELKMDARMLDELVAACEREAPLLRRVQDQVERYLQTARICRTSGHPHTAIRLFRKAIDCACEAEYRDGTLRFRDQVMEAARAVEALWRESFPDSGPAGDLKDALETYRDLFLVFRCGE